MCDIEFDKQSPVSGCILRIEKCEFSLARTSCARVVYLFYVAVLTALLFQSCLPYFSTTTMPSSLSVYSTYMQTYSPITRVVHNDLIAISRSKLAMLHALLAQPVGIGRCCIPEYDVKLPEHGRWAKDAHVKIFMLHKSERRVPGRFLRAT